MPLDKPVTADGGEPKVRPQHVGPTYVIDGSPMSVETIATLSLSARQLEFSHEIWEKIAKGRSIVDRVLTSGTPIYGTTTGIGSQKNVAVGARELAEFSNRMIISEASNYPGPAYSDRDVRAALLVLLNNVATGRTGIRPELACQILHLYASTRLPIVRRDCSFGAGDLTPLSQLSLALIGRSLDGQSPILPAAIHLAPKESCS